MRQKLILFDIDGTLVSSGDFLERYQIFLNEKFSEFFGKPVDFDFSGLHGKTERGNLKILLKRRGIEPTEKELDDFFKFVGENYIASNRDAVLLPYVKRTIRSLSKTNLLGLTTGNPELVARKKLKVVGLEDYFPFGGFGNESDVRGEIVNLALSRARNYGWRGEKKEIYVVGDTPGDVEAGKYAGIRTVAITTGPASKENLLKANPDYLIGNLSELESIEFKKE